MKLSRHFVMISILLIAILSVCLYWFAKIHAYHEKGDFTETFADIELVGTIQGGWEDRLYEQYEMNQQRGGTYNHGHHLYWWMQIVSEKDRKDAAKTYDIDIPELDFGKHYYILSFGRKLNGVKYDNDKISKSGGMYSDVEIDFSNDHPDTDTAMELENGEFVFVSNLRARNVYIYAMDKILLMDTRVENEDLMKLNYADHHMLEMPLSYVGEMEGDWTDWFQGIYGYQNSLTRKLRNEGVSWWYQIHGDWEWYQDTFQIQDQKPELNEKKYVISLGRQIEHLWYSTNTLESGAHYAKAAFQMSDYQPNTIYIYEMDQEISFMNTILEDEDLRRFNFMNVYDGVVPIEGGV